MQEKELAPIIKPLNDFIEAELFRLKTIMIKDTDKSGTLDDLNKLFADTLQAYSILLRNN